MYTSYTGVLGLKRENKCTGESLESVLDWIQSD